MTIIIEDIMKILSDKIRLRILNILSEKPRCVCELTAILDLPQSTVSRHLAKMRLTNIVKTEKMDSFTIYSLNEKYIKKYTFIKWLIKDLNKEFKNDLEKAKNISIVNGSCSILK
ncbi:hypothetical protein JCM30566_09880 [Marinitoga arctica]